MVATMVYLSAVAVKISYAIAARTYLYLQESTAVQNRKKIY